MKNRRIVYLAIVIFAFTCGCVFPTHGGYGSVDLSVNWGDLSNDLWSKGYAVNFYDQGDGKHTLDTSSTSSDLYDKLLVVGSYNLLSYSIDDPDIEIRNIDSYEAASAVIAPLSGGTKSSTMTLGQPTSFYVFDNGAVPITVSAIPQGAIKMMPKNYVREVEITINLRGDAKMVSSATMTLSGVANGINLLTGVPFSDTGKKNIVTRMDIRPDDMVVTTLSVFGAAARVENETIKNEFVIDLFFKNDNDEDNGDQKVRRDVTAEMGALITKSDQKIKITVDIEISQQADATVHATVTDWIVKVVEKDIPRPSN